MTELAGKVIGVVAAEAFVEPAYAVLKEKLERRGAEVVPVACSGRRLDGWQHAEAAADSKLSTADLQDYDALVLPGGEGGVTALRSNRTLLALVSACHQHDRIVSATGQAVLILLSSLPVEGRKISADPTLREELVEAGVEWSEEAVVKDDKILTCRSTVEIDAFIEELHACLIETQPFQATA